MHDAELSVLVAAVPGVEQIYLLDRMRGAVRITVAVAAGHPVPSTLRAVRAAVAAFLRAADEADATITVKASRIAG